MFAERIKPVVFYSYAHEDAALLEKLKKQLASLKRKGLICEWYDREISAGAEWNEEIARHLDAASVILLLISSDFIDSDYCNDVEVKRAMERHTEGSARVIPVILRATNWEGLPFSKLKALPSDGRPVTSWPNEDEALLDIAKGVEDAMNELNPSGSFSTGGTAPRLSPLSHIEPESAVGFVSRKDRDGNDIIEKLRADLTPGSSRVVALWGAGGVGKTALAAEAVRSLIYDYQQRVAWVSADGREEFSLPSLLDAISDQLGRSEFRTLAIRAKKQAVQGLMTEAPALIVLDNFETVKPREQSLCLEWLCHVSPSSALITTRARIEIPTIRNIPIKPLFVSEASEFLNRLVQQAQHRRTFDGIDKERLIETAEANPLILQWVFAQVDQAQDWREVLNELAQGEGDAAHRVFDRSFNLPLLNNGGRAALLALSLFVPSASRSALAEVTGLSGERNKRRFKEATRHLAALWLIRTTEDASRLTVEGLTRDLAKTRLDSDHRNASIRQRFVARFNSFARNNSDENAADLNSLETEKENLLAAVDVACATKSWKSAIELYLHIVPFLNIRGHWDELIGRGEKAKIGAVETKNQHAFGSVAENIATVLSNRGEYAEAEQIYDEVLNVFKDLKSDEGVAATLYNLGILHEKRGDMNKSRQLHKQSLDIHKTLGIQYKVARVLNALGHTAHVEGEMAEALSLFRSSLDISNRLKNPRDIAAVLYNIGKLDEDHGEMESSYKLYSDSLELLRKLGDQSGIAVSLNALGSLARQQGQTTEAFKLSNASLEIDKRLGNQSGLARTLHKLGLIARDQGNITEARQLIEQSLEIQRHLGNQLGIGIMLRELGTLSLDEGAFKDAETALNEAIVIIRRLNAMGFLAEALETQGRLRTVQGSFIEAREFFREALEIAQALNQKPIIANIKYSSAQLEEKENHITLALNLLHQALEIFEYLRFAKAEKVKADLDRLKGA